MSVTPDYTEPNLNAGEPKWQKIEIWRNDLIPTFNMALGLFRLPVAHWRLVNVVYSPDGVDILELVIESPTGDQAKATMTYSDHKIDTMVLQHKRVPVSGVFETTTPGTLTTTWVGNNLTAYSWS